jgi:hypothetical protein
MALLLANMKAPLCLQWGEMPIIRLDFLLELYEERATLAYLLESPNESHNIHVVT